MATPVRPSLTSDETRDRNTCQSSSGFARMNLNSEYSSSTLFCG